MKNKEEEVDFTQAEDDTLRATSPKHIKALAKEWDADPSSLFSRRLYLLRHSKQSNAKSAAHISVELDGTSVVKTVSLPELKNKMVIRHGNTSILINKDEVGGITFDGADMIVHHYKA